MLAIRNWGVTIAKGWKQRGVLAAVLLMLIVGIGVSHKFENGAPLRVAAHRWPGYETLFYARQHGGLDERRVRLIETPSASDSLRALQQGRIDAAALTLDEALRLAARSGEEFVVVLVFDISAGADAVLVRPPLRDLRALKGRRIGVETSGVGYLMLAHLLREANLGLHEVIIEPVNVDQQEAAWKSGRLDALISYEPVSRRIEALGAKRLFDSRALDGQIVDVLVVRASVLANGQEKALKALLAAHFQVLAALRRNPTDLYHRLSARLGLTVAETEHAYRLLRLPDATENRRLLTPHPSPPLAETAARALAALATVDRLPFSAPPPNLRYSAAYLP